MSEHDDRVAAAYRALGREEPSGALDAAILAASKRAVAPARRSRNWGVPVSIAALLMLSAGLTLNMQREQPGIELQEPAARTAAPPRDAPAPTPVPSAPPASSADAPMQAPAAEEQLRYAAKPQALKEKKADAPPPQKLSRPMEAVPAPFPEADLARKDSNFAERRQAMPAASPVAPPPVAEPAAAPAARAAATTSAVRTEPPPGAPSLLAKERTAAESGAVAQAPVAAGAVAPAEKAAPMMAPRAKREGANVAADSLSREAQPVDELQRELERIAKLRTEGRDAEADKALEEFRKKNPDYRIAPAMWERVKRRQ